MQVEDRSIYSIVGSELLGRLGEVHSSGRGNHGYFAVFRCLGKEHFHSSGYVLDQCNLRCSFPLSIAAVALIAPLAAGLDLGFVQKIGAGWRGLWVADEECFRASHMRIASCRWTVE